MKRLFDIIFSIIILVFSSPILIVSLIIVFFEDLKNPIYSPFRVGKNGKKFKMYKIRSMAIHADRDGVESTSVNDKRITKSGKIIRKYKIDELTQFVNVFLGNMSVVGPRPNSIKEVDKY